LLVIAALIIPLLELLRDALAVAERHLPEHMLAEEQSLLSFYHLFDEGFQPVVDWAADLSILHHRTLAVEASELELLQGELQAIFAQRMSAGQHTGPRAVVAFSADWTVHFLHLGQVFREQLNGIDYKLGSLAHE